MVDRSASGSPSLVNAPRYHDIIINIIELRAIRIHLLQLHVGSKTFRLVVLAVVAPRPRSRLQDLDVTAYARLPSRRGIITPAASRSDDGRPGSQERFRANRPRLHLPQPRAFAASS